MELTKAIIVKPEDYVSKALSKMKESGMAAFVFDGKKYLGEIDERKMREKRFDPAKTKCSKIATRTPVLAPDMEISDICRAFFAGRFKTLPVMDGTKVVGTVDRWAIMTAIEKAGYLKGHKISEHMSSPIMTVNSHASASVANAIMRDANVRRLAVTQNGSLVGVVSVFDLLPTRERDEKRNPKMNLQKSAQENLPVYSFMKQEVETIGMDASLTDAVRRMLEAKKAALIVVDGQRPVGIITSKDVLKTAVMAQENLPVIVSGLEGIDKELCEDIVSIGEKLLQKIRKEGATGLSIHVKGEGKQYFVSAHVTGEMKLRAHASNYELIAAVHEAVGELAVQARKMKITGISGRRN